MHNRFQHKHVPPKHVPHKHIQPKHIQHEHIQPKHITRTFWLVWGFLLAVLLGVFVGFAQTTPQIYRSNNNNMVLGAEGIDDIRINDTPANSDASNELQFTSLTAQLEHGTQTYDLHCATCHGDTGRGFAEATLAFPEDHRHCHYCHRRNNPPQMPLATMTSRNAFDIGEAPALVGEDTLNNFGSTSALHAYSQATMPRPFPGELDDATYLAITVHLLHLRGALPAELTASNQPVKLEQIGHLRS